MRILLFLPIILFSQSVIASQFPGNSLNYTTADGLPSNETYKVIQDATGYLWIATDRGMARFDYTGFKLYGLNEGLGNLLCTGAQLDANGVLVVYCHKKSFYRYNQVLDKFEELQINDLPEALNVFDYYFDKDNNLWFSQSGFKFYSCDPSGRLTVLEHDIDPDNYVYSTLIYQGPQPLVSTQHKLNEQFPSVEFRDKMIIINDGGCYHATILSSGICLATTSDEIIIADPASKKSKVFPYKTNQIESFYYEGEDLIFIGSGIYVLDENWNLVRKEFLNQYVITSAYLDKEGNFWVSSHDHGLIRYFPNITSVHSDHGTLTDVEFIANEVYVTSTTGHILKFDREGLQLRSVHKFKQPQYEIKLCDGLIYNRFGFLYDPINDVEQAAPYVNKEGRYPIISNAFDQSIQICGIGQFQFYRGKLQVPSNNNESFKEIRHSIIVGSSLFVCHPLGISKMEIKDAGDSILVGRSTLIRDSCEVSSVVQSGNFLFFSTLEDGVQIYDLTSDMFIALQDVSYLPTLRVNAVKCYSDTLLVFSNIGLFVYVFDAVNPTDRMELVYVMNSSTGLKSPDVRNGRLINGYLVLVGDAYINFVKLSSIKNVNSATPLIISNVTDLISKQTLFQGDELSHDQNSLRLEFKYLSLLLGPDDRSYRIKLSRNGSDVLESFTTESFAQFYNLEPGRYQFEVSAMDQYGNWSNAQVFEFRIHPHFTQTIWFKVLVILLIGSLVYSFIHARNKRRLNRLRLQQTLDEETIKLKEATLSKFKLQMNPHFVYNALNSIQFLFYDNKKEEANRYLNTFAYLLRRGIENSERLTIPISEEIELIRSYVSIEKLRFPDRFEIEVTVDDVLLEEEYSFPPHLVQPILENAIKHAFPEDKGSPGKITVAYSYDVENQQIVVTIEDNGIGIDKKSSTLGHNSKGLIIVQSQLNILNQNASSDSSMVIEDLSKYGSTGTRVIIKVKGDFN